MIEYIIETIMREVYYVNCVRSWTERGGNGTYTRAYYLKRKNESNCIKLFLLRDRAYYLLSNLFHTTPKCQTDELE